MTREPRRAFVVALAVAVVFIGLSLAIEKQATLNLLLQVSVARYEVRLRQQWKREAAEDIARIVVRQIVEEHKREFPEHQHP